MRAKFWRQKITKANLTREICFRTKKAFVKCWWNRHLVLVVPLQRWLDDATDVNDEEVYEEADEKNEENSSAQNENGQTKIRGQAWIDGSCVVWLRLRDIRSRRNVVLDVFRWKVDFHCDVMTFSYNVGSENQFFSIFKFPKIKKKWKVKLVTNS